MEPAGLLGIMKLTIFTIRKNLKHFLCMAVLGAIPCAFHIPVLDIGHFSLATVVIGSISLYEHTLSKQLPPSPASLPPLPNTDPPFPDLHDLAPLFLIAFFSITFSLISQPLLAFSVCRSYLDKSISLKGSSLGILRSVKNLTLTSLCIGMLLLGYTAMTLGIMSILAGVAMAFGVLSGNAASAGAIGFCTIIVSGSGGVYMAISFSLAHTVAILEEKTSGWRAMKRSMDLLAGRKLLALMLMCVLNGVLVPFYFSGLWRWRGARIVSVSLQAVLWTMGMVAYVVLYMSCKKQRDEPLLTLVAANPEFGPPEFSLKPMDIETAGLLPALPK